MDLSSEAAEQDNEQDQDSAILERLFELAEQGNAEARCDVGRYHSDGWRVPVNLSKVLEWFS